MATPLKVVSILAAIAIAIVAGIARMSADDGAPLEARAGVPAVAAQTTAGDCDHVAAPGETMLTALTDALEPGETACLRSGAHGDPQQEIKIETPGITLAAYPGDRAVVQGRIWIAGGADGVTVEGLVLDGRNPDGLPSPTVNADRAKFRANEVTNHATAICFLIGDDAYGRAVGTSLIGNRIHDCGQIPPTNHHHGVYVAHAEQTRVERNWIYSNADRGVQLYPDARRTLVLENVIEGNGQGVIFGGNEESASSRNVVRGNVIANSLLRHNVESDWSAPGPVGSQNVVAGNCLYGGAIKPEEGGLEAPESGFEAYDNIVAPPRFVDRAAGDLRLRDGPCADVLQ